MPLLAVQRFAGMNDHLESAMFWVGALLATLPVLILLGVLGWVLWRRRSQPEATGSDPADS